MNRHALSYSKLAAGLLIGSLAASPALTQGMLEEVIVTAQKREQSLQDVPIAVSAFTGEMLERAGVKDMFDLQVNAPSLIVSQSQTSTTSTFSIRGVFTSSQNFGLESSVGLYVDGVYRARQGSMINNLLDVASVEVLRGPQGTLFGRNTPAGAVQINSVAPDFEGTGFLEATAGDYDLYGVSGAKSLTIIDDVLAIRGTGFYMNRDGYVDWIGQDGVKENDAFNDRDRWGVRLQALYTPTDDLTVRTIIDQSKVNEVCCGTGTWKNNFFPEDGGTLPANPNWNPPPANGPTDQYIADAGGVVLNGNDWDDDQVVTAAREPKSKNDDKGISVQVDWETEPFLVTSITAYREHSSFDDADILFTNLDGAYRVNDSNQEQFTQEFRITGEMDKFNYVAGLYYYHQKLKNDRTTTVGDDTTIIALGPNFPSSFFIGGTGSRDLNDQKHESYAVFGQADYNLTDALVLTAGLRWTYEDKKMENIFTQDVPVPGDPTGNFGFTAFPPLTPTPDLKEDFDDNKVTGTVKLSWFATDAIMLYGSYGTGYKSGGINTDRINPVFNPIFDAEEAKSYEVGMKAEFPEQALRVNVALHKTDTDNLQTVSFQGGGFVLSNAGTAETYGGEIDLNWAATDSTTLTLAYAYNHGEYENFEDGPCWTGQPWQTGQPGPGNPNPNGPSGACDRSGGDLSGNPENVVVVTGNQNFRLSDALEGFVYAEYIWTDKRMTDVNNDPEKFDDAYALVNARVGVRYEPWDTVRTLWGRNLTDEMYTSPIADAPAQTGRYIAYYTEPLTWGLTIRKDF